jgi:molecular chaperone DnaJ
VRTRRTLTVKIPPGVDNGTRIQLAGEGEVGPGAGPAGDLYIEIVEEPHSIFQRRGDDLHCTVTMPMTAASLGTKIPLETLDGSVDLDIRPGTQSGQAITLRGRGIQHLRGSTRGDLVVHVDVQTPKNLDPEQEELLRKLARLRGEERPSGTFAPGQQRLFSRIKDAINNR